MASENEELNFIFYLILNNLNLNNLILNNRHMELEATVLVAYIWDGGIFLK